MCKIICNHLDDDHLQKIFCSSSLEDYLEHFEIDLLNKRKREREREREREKTRYLQNKS